MDHLTTFDDENEFRLDKADSATLRDFLRSKSFVPFLTALDTDFERVAKRESQSKQAAKLHELHESRGKQNLHRWLRKPEEYDPLDYAGIPFPSNPVPSADWVHLKKVVMPVAEGEGDIMPRIVNHLTQYTHALHYKLDELLEMVNDKSTSSKDPTPEWDDLVGKYPFLSKCDDHVRLVPKVPPLLLSRTPAVTSHPASPSRPARHALPRLIFKLFYQYAMILCDIYDSRTPWIFILT